MMNEISLLLARLQVLQSERSLLMRFYDDRIISSPFYKEYQKRKDEFIKSELGGKNNA